MLTSDVCALLILALPKQVFCQDKQTTVGEEELGAPAGNRLEVRATSIVSSDNAQRADLLPEREAGS